MTSPRDQIAAAVAPCLRELQDAKLDLMGTKTQILRISKAPADDFGFKVASYSSEIIRDAILQYPMSKIWIAQMKTGTGAATVETVKAVNLAEILPVTMYVKFNGIITAENTCINEGDIVVDVITDEQGSKLPIRLECEKVLGTFQGKQLIGRYYELSLSRKVYSTAIELLITNFIATF